MMIGIECDEAKAMVSIEIGDRDMEMDMNKLKSGSIKMVEFEIGVWLGFDDDWNRDGDDRGEDE